MTGRLQARAVKPGGVRDGLYAAYAAVYGIPSAYASPSLSPRVSAAKIYGKEALEASPGGIFTIPRDGVLCYETHGLIIVNLPHGFSDPWTLVDVSSIGVSGVKPQYAWIKNRSPESLNVLLASAKSAEQRVPACAVKLDTQKSLEGLALEFDHKVNPNAEIPYKVSLRPLYAPSQKL